MQVNEYSCDVTAYSVFLRLVSPNHPTVNHRFLVDLVQKTLISSEEN